MKQNNQKFHNKKSESKKEKLSESEQKELNWK